MTVDLAYENRLRADMEALIAEAERRDLAYATGNLLPQMRSDLARRPEGWLETLVERAKGAAVRLDWCSEYESSMETLGIPEEWYSRGGPPTEYTVTFTISMDFDLGAVEVPDDGEFDDYNPTYTLTQSTSFESTEDECDEYVTRFRSDLEQFIEGPHTYSPPDWTTQAFDQAVRSGSWTNIRIADYDVE